MRAFDQPEPLTDAELDRLGEFFRKCKGGKTMNIEELDGFFSALIAGPEMVPPSEYLPEVFGGEMTDTCEFAGFDEANDILGLMMRHWNTIVAALHNEDVYLPILFEDENGVCLGNNWARGFIRGVGMRKESWAELMTDEEHAGLMIPVLSLYHEHNKNPEMRPGPIGRERREQIIVGMAIGIVGAYGTFGYIGSTRQAVTPANLGATLPRLGGTIRARAVLARNTSVAAAGRRYTKVTTTESLRF